jgi:hypothetical protein
VALLLQTWHHHATTEHLLSELNIKCIFAQSMKAIADDSNFLMDHSGMSVDTPVDALDFLVLWQLLTHLWC